MTLYDTDFYAWTQHNARLLRSGHAEEADLENVAEEIASLGRSERRALASRLAVLIGHELRGGGHFRECVDVYGRAIRARDLAELRTERSLRKAPCSDKPAAARQRARCRWTPADSTTPPATG